MEEEKIKKEDIVISKLKHKKGENYDTYVNLLNTTDEEYLKKYVEHIKESMKDEFSKFYKEEGLLFIEGNMSRKLIWPRIEEYVSKN